jgi:hypothetical protein
MAQNLSSLSSKILVLNLVSLLAVKKKRRPDVEPPLPWHRIAYPVVDQREELPLLPPVE